MNDVVNYSDKSQGLLQDFSDLLTDKAGEIKSLQAELYLEKDATPIFCRARTVTYALREGVNEELQNLQDADIIKPVTNSRWATPIVPVVKPSGDFKVTLNKFLKVEKYPLPKIEDMLATLGGGEHFTKIDLKQAYIQLPVDEKSQELLNINTTKGLFQFLNPLKGGGIYFIPPTINEVLHQKNFIKFYFSNFGGKKP